jgi:transcriptional regulator with XRE-family HTH domain
MDKSQLESTIGERIRKFAKAQHGSVAELTRAIGKGRNFLGAYVEGRAKPGSEILAAISDAGCNINWLLTGQGEMLRTAEPAAQYIGEIAAGRPKAAGEQAPMEVVTGVAVAGTLTILTNDGRKILVVLTDK